MNTLVGKSAIVVGGSGGLGSAVARFLAGSGAAVAVLYHAHPSAAQRVVTEIESAGGQALAFPVNVAVSESVEQMAAGVLAAFGRIDILINSAGISRNGVSWKASDDDWHTTLETNLTGAFRCARAVLPTMRTQGWGRIINVSSIVGQIGVAGTTAYAATKAGLVGMTRSMALEVANKGVTVNALALGYFDTGIIADVPPDLLEKIVATIPIRRLGKVTEMCHAVGFLCADEASYITGQTLNINGGLYLG